MAIQKTEAIVLKTQPFRSSSLIITFFTRDFGKIRGIAKGVRQENQTRAAVYELFTRLEIIYYEKLRSDLHLVSDAAILESLRRTLESLRRPRSEDDRRKAAFVGRLLGEPFAAGLVRERVDEIALQLRA